MQHHTYFSPEHASSAYGEKAAEKDEFSYPTNGTDWPVEEEADDAEENPRELPVEEAPQSTSPSTSVIDLSFMCP